VYFTGGIGAADESIGPSVRENRGPQDDKMLTRFPLALAIETIHAARSSEIHPFVTIL
jgi:hypothetical protein